MLTGIGYLWLVIAAGMLHQACLDQGISQATLHSVEHQRPNLLHCLEQPTVILQAFFHC